MSEPRPLLAFGPPVVAAIPTLPHGSRPSPPQIRGPGARRQGERLTPRFEALQQAMESGRAALGDSPGEPDPEMVVVFDLVGTAEDFARAVSKVPGLEFLAELEDDDAEPDDDFHFLDQAGRRSDDTMSESLYMVMTNAQAVMELIRLFHLWETDQSAPFDRGLNPLRSAFHLLRDVRRWGPQDRVRETGLLRDWEETVQMIGGAQSSVRVEIELWFRADAARRTAAQAEVARLVEQAGGAVVHSAVVDGVGYHGVLADLPHREVRAVLAGGPQAIALLTTDEVMFVAPAQPMTLPSVQPAPDVTAPAPADAPPDRPPRVALLDGVPLANHSTLAGRLVLDDPDDIASRYTSDRQQHGTAMASLILHGDLSDPGTPLSTRLYVRPVFQPHPFVEDSETIVQGELLVDLVHRAFLRMFEKDGGREAAAPSVRIVNLSIGDPARVFVRRLSPLAKLLDWMAHRYNLLVFVSAGNHPITATVPADAISDPGALGKALLRHRREQALHRRLLAPAEAINVLTIGAVHADGWSGHLPDTVLSGVDSGMPALYSAGGFGHRRSVKPEILLPGGRSLFQRPPLVQGAAAVTMSSANATARGPGMLVAAPGSSSITTAYLSGTSNAAALGSRTANQIFDVLEGLDAGTDEFAFPDPQYHPVLAKTLLVHAASWGPLQGTLRTALDLQGTAVRREITQLLGYGPVDPDRVASASRTRVMLLGAGSITDGERHSFRFPLPAALAATTAWRRLTITLGWLSPVNTRTQRHRMARLRFQPPQTQMGVTRRQANHDRVVRGTVQHEVLEGTDAVAFTAADALAIDVDCRVDVGKLERPVRYGLAASVEMATTVRADIHAQVRQQLQVRQRQQATRVAARATS